MAHWMELQEMDVNGLSPNSWTTGPFNNTPDIEDGANYCGGGLNDCAVQYSVSNDGGTWVGMAFRGDTGFFERIWQGVNLIENVTYTISFEQANFGSTSNDGYTGTGILKCCIIQDLVNPLIL